MKRKIFFWLERLKITPAERKTVSGLMILLVLLGSLNLALSPSIPFEDEDYLELEKQFEKRAAMLEAEEEKLMQKYYPSEKEEVYVAKKDTIVEDTLAQVKDQKADQNAENEQININTAGEKALKSLPGIGSVYAQRIIKYREENDGFETIEELKRIKGIAQKRLEKLKPFVKLKDSKK
jgi:comEA protein